MYRGSPSAVWMCREPSHIAGRKMSCGSWKETVAVAEDYMRSRCSSPHPAPPPPSESAAAMRRSAQDMETQHQARFQSSAQGFVKHGGTDLCSNLRKVMDESVGDGLFNWGRVVALVTFAGVSARQSQEQRGKSPGRDPGKQPESHHEPVSCRESAETIADYSEKHKKDWSQENNGWDGFCSYARTAREVNQDSSMKTASVAVAGVGIAGLTFLSVR